MNKKTAIDILTKHEVLILGYNPTHNYLLKVRLMANLFKKDVSVIMNDINDKITFEDGKLVFRRSSLVLDVQKIIIILYDEHDKNIIYIKGDNYALALYIIKDGKNENK